MIRDAVLAGVRGLALVLAAAALLVLILITLNLAQFGPVRLFRYREPTWVLYGALALFASARNRPGEYLRMAAARARGVLGSGRFFLLVGGISLPLYLLVSYTSHLSFHTFSHDFSMFDEALYQSHRGRFLFSPILGRSLLTEHFSPILALLVPLHALLPSPYLLVVVNALLLWAAVLPLRALLDSLGVSVTARNVACLIYLTNPVTASALDYGFHVESFLPVTVFGLLVLHRRGPSWAFWGCLVLSLAIKEDVGIYSAGVGAYLFFAERRRRRGLVTVLASLSWVAVALYVITPRIPGATPEYRFLDRWAAWGGDPFGIVVGMITHPLEWVRVLVAPPYILFFYRLLGTPFLTARGWLLFAIAWVLTATSGLPQHSTLGLYYGLPLLSYAGLASASGLASPVARRIAASRLAPAIVALAVVLNVAHFTFHPVPRERRAVLAALDRIPDAATIQAMPCFFPVLEYERSKSVLMPGDRLEADYVVLRSSVTAWPFSTEAVEGLVRRAEESGQYARRFRAGGFTILERR